MTHTLILQAASVIGGLFLLYFGGNFLVKGAASLARKLNVPVIIVGLTVVAFGTSAPELFVSMLSAFRGLMSVSIGNVIGSNIINIALILGMASAIYPMTASKKITFVDVPLMIGTYLVMFLVLANFTPRGIKWAGGVITTGEGVLMVGLLAAYLYSLYRYGKNKGVEELEEIHVEEIEESPEGSIPLLTGKIVLGVTFLAGGAHLLVGGASWVAREIFGVSERFIGITIVALGTSLPELVTSVVAAARKEMDISLGNIVGSNIFNSLMVLGATAIVRNIDVGSTGFEYDFLFMIGISLLLFLILAIKGRIPRWGGLTFLMVYAGYFYFLIQTRTL